MKINDEQLKNVSGGIDNSTHKYQKGDEIVSDWVYNMRQRIVIVDFKETINGEDYYYVNIYVELMNGTEFSPSQDVLSESQIINSNEDFKRPFKSIGVI